MDVFGGLGGALRGVQVQRAWADWAVGDAGDCVGVGHVGCVQGERRRGWEHGAGCDGGRTRRVAHGEPVFRWKHGIERGGDQLWEDGGREPDRERGGLGDKQVLKNSHLLSYSDAADGCVTVHWMSYTRGTVASI